MAVEILNTARTPVRSAKQASDMLERALGRLVAHRYDADRHVMDYGALTAAYELKDLVAAADALPSIDPLEITDVPARTSFWLNVWNALLLHTLVHARPSGNVRHVDGLFTARAYRVGAHELTLDDIEHGILRANPRRGIPPARLFARDDPRLPLAMANVDPRIHFGFYTACASSPPLQAFAAGDLERQLADGARTTLDRSVRASGRKLHVPRTFSWYQEDFGGSRGVIDFLRKHLPDDSRRQALADVPERVTLEYLEYDWTLNDAWDLAGVH